MKESNEFLKTIQLNQVYDYCFGKTLDSQLKATDKNSPGSWINFNPSKELSTLTKTITARKFDT